MKVTLFRRISTVFGLVLVASNLLSACHGDGIGLSASGDLEGATGFAAEIQPLFDRHCVRCHSPGGLGFNQTGGSEKNGLNLTPGYSHNSLVNQPSFELPDMEPKWRVRPGDPDGSYIIQKISPGTPKFKSRMPTDGPPYPSEMEIQLIRDWILRGAPND